MVRIRKRYNLPKAPPTDCDSSRTSSEEDDDTEGSLADFIEHDSDEGDGEDSYREEDEDEPDDGDDDASDASEDEQVTRRPKRARLDVADDVEETTTEEDPDEAIKRQYTPDMETTCGSVITDTGVRRSMRSNKGRAPVRYVDEDYAELMLEDVRREDREALARELSEEEDEEEASDASEGADEETEDEST